MQELWKINGRLGNQMFQFAFCYSIAKDLGVDFYFQDPKYFEKYANEIKAIFGDTTWTGVDFYKIDEIEPVSIHVRRGDYAGNSFYTDLTQTDYYEKAIAEFPGRKFVVFSDDIEFCKQYFKGRGFYFSEGNTELEDMNLMSRCNGHIIANSTFSWWGAWLGKGKTVAPKQWYADGIERTKCPVNWLRV